MILFAVELDPLLDDSLAIAAADTQTILCSARTDVMPPTGFTVKTAVDFLGVSSPIQGCCCPNMKPGVLSA